MLIHVLRRNCGTSLVQTALLGLKQVAAAAGRMHLRDFVECDLEEVEMSFFDNFGLEECAQEVCRLDGQLVCGTNMFKYLLRI